MKKILTIAGSDSGGGAGIQADLKTITVLGAYGLSVITALTAQNTLGVQGVHPVPEAFILQQLESVLSDIGADAAKTGMLATPGIVRAVAQGIKKYGVSPLVVDPVMVAESGDPLLTEDARETIKDHLLPLARVVTPNLDEAEILSGQSVRSIEAMREAAKKIHDMGPGAVLIKGGHLSGKATDLLFDGRSFETFEVPRLDRKSTHGTGCTFSAALTTYLGQGLGVVEAVDRAKAFITRAIAHSVEIGAGHGPTNPFSHLRRGEARDALLRDLRKALNRLLQVPVGGLIPEVRSNLGYALPQALDYGDVAAVPGRMTKVGTHALVVRDPSFGASRHIARVIFAAMGHSPDMRAAMNIAYSPEIISACQGLGLAVAHFDRENEPGDVREREGATLEWGVARALKGLERAPDIIYDRGGMGKEPMVRVLGTDPENVVDKVASIAHACGFSGE